MSLVKSIQGTIRKKIKSLDTTPYELEQKSGLPKGSIYKVMTGYINNPSLETLDKISAVLQYESIAEFFKDIDNQTSNKTTKLTKPLEWDESLFNDIVKLTISKTKVLHSDRRLKNKKIDTGRILFIIKEIYEYTLLKDSNKKEMDLVFCNWFIENNSSAIFI
jgi:transcriptional regulator with XRE-family HTH domain